MLLRAGHLEHIPQPTHTPASLFKTTPCTPVPRAHLSLQRIRQAPPPPPPPPPRWLPTTTWTFSAPCPGDASHQHPLADIRHCQMPVEQSARPYRTPAARFCLPLTLQHHRQLALCTHTAYYALEDDLAPMVKARATGTRSDSTRACDLKQAAVTPLPVLTTLVRCPNIHALRVALMRVDATRRPSGRSGSTDSRTSSCSAH